MIFLQQHWGGCVTVKKIIFSESSSLLSWWHSHQGLLLFFSFEIHIPSILLSSILTELVISKKLKSSFSRWCWKQANCAWRELHSHAGFNKNIANKINIHVLLPVKSGYSWAWRRRTSSAQSRRRRAAPADSEHGTICVRQAMHSWYTYKTEQCNIQVQGEMWSSYLLVRPCCLWGTFSWSSME